MQTCRDLLRALGDYLDGSIDPARRWALEGHLERCGRCRILLDTTRRTVELYRRQPPCCVPAELESRVLQSIERRAGLKH